MSTNDESIRIQLSKRGKNAGKYEAIIDSIDSDLADLNWKVLSNQIKYALRTVTKNKNRKTIWLHREIMSRVLGRNLLATEEVDHIDCDGLNNRRENLRLATPEQNKFNKGKYRRNSSGFKGVSWHKRQKKWTAQIQVNKNKIHIGSFDTPEEAHRAYCDAAQKYHGEFANYGDGGK